MSHHEPEGYAQLLTVNETASLLNISRPTVYRLIRSREIAPVRVGQRLRFEPSEVRRYLDAGRAVSVP